MVTFTASSHKVYDPDGNLYCTSTIDRFASFIAEGLTSWANLENALPDPIAQDFTVDGNNVLVDGEVALIAAHSEAANALVFLCNIAVDTQIFGPVTQH